MLRILLQEYWKSSSLQDTFADVSTTAFPSKARIVIIGGGVGGTSVAHHLAELGEKEVILLERSDLTSGSTFHSAGLVGQLRADPTLTKMNMHSVDLYRSLEKTDTPASWRECGSIKLASTPERMEEIRRQIGWARTFGLDLHEISPDASFVRTVAPGVVWPAARKMRPESSSVMLKPRPRMAVGSSARICAAFWPQKQPV